MRRARSWKEYLIARSAKLEAKVFWKESSVARDAKLKAYTLERIVSCSWYEAEKGSFERKISTEVLLLNAGSVTLEVSESLARYASFSRCAGSVGKLGVLLGY